MKKILFLTLLFSSLFFAKNKYLDNYSCNECHEKIYEEYQTSAHSRGYFNDELHRKIADKVSTKKYTCAVCHMPMADNLKELIEGKARPNKNNKTHTDAVSCFFCHTIAYVKKAHQYNLNVKARQAENYKPTIYGRLFNPEDSDKHSSSKNPIYGQKVCLGCHSHKLNDNNVTIFRAMTDKQTSIKCIECHMPEIKGGVEKMNKRSRGQHASHKFLGIHDKEFRAKGVDINISTSKDSITVTLTNKMAHPLIIQPSRVKYLVVQIIRDNKVIWKNYKNDPKEDKDVFFEYRFYDKSGNRLMIPANSYSREMTNLDAYKSKSVTYKNISLKKGDIIKATMFVKFAKRDCQLIIDLKDNEFKKAFILKESVKIFK
jgi:hypothetical protein